MLILLYAWNSYVNRLELKIFQTQNLTVVFTYQKIGMLVWTRIFHVRPHSIGETRFFIIFVKNWFLEKKVGVATYFIFIFEGKIKQEIKP